MSILGIFENVVSDFLFVLIAIVLGWIFFALSRRANLLKFFGVNDSRRVVVYLSNLRVVKGGAVGVDNRLRSYEGPAAAFGEMIGANRFRDLFNYLLPSLSENPGILSKLLISDVQVQLIHSPSDQGQLERSSTFITLGSPAYNIASHFAENSLHTRAKFRLGTVDSSDQNSLLETSSPSASDMYSHATGSVVADTFNFPSSGSMGTIEAQPPFSPRPSGLFMNAHLQQSNVPPRSQPSEEKSAILVDDVPPMTDSTLGFVERMVDRENKRCVFYVAGISELATTGAANFLISEWMQLHRKYGTDKNFLIMLRIESSDYRRWSIVFEK